MYSLSIRNRSPPRGSTNIDSASTGCSGYRNEIVSVLVSVPVAVKAVVGSGTRYTVT